MDEIPDAESFQFHSLIVVFGYLLLVLGHSLGGLVSDFVQVIKVQPQLIVIALFVKELPPEANEPHFD